MQSGPTSRAGPLHPSIKSLPSSNLWSENRLQEILDRYRHAANVLVNLQACDEKGQSEASGKPPGDVPPGGGHLGESVEQQRLPNR